MSKDNGRSKILNMKFSWNEDKLGVIFVKELPKRDYRLLGFKLFQVIRISDSKFEFRELEEC